jgi:glycosyltransferase involved in cell wall biosynthesis
VKDLSIIIPTYKNTKFLKECFGSILNSIRNYDVEIIVGVDACLETLEFIRSNVFDDRINFYFFEKNQGPYIIKNSFLKITKSENLLFFDSDDIMCENMIESIIQNLKSNNVVKPSYVEFIDGQKINTKSKVIKSEGVFAIKKNLLIKFNGFEPWICGADTELSFRLVSNNVKFKFLREILFYRRLHKNGLTSRKDTGSGSEIRRKYSDIILSKIDRGPLETLTTADYKNLKDVNKSKVQEINDLFIPKEKNKIVISKILKIT